MKEILPMLGKSFVLKGGTALMLYYGLDRYSEDIGLDTFDEMDIRKYLINPGYDIWNIRVAKDTPTVFRVLIDYGAKSDLGAYPLKIEISARNKKMLNKNAFKICNIKGVNVYDISELINMKVATFGNRDKIRDLYDIGFLVRKYPLYFNENQLKSAFTNMQYKGLENLSLQLKDEFYKHILGDILPDDYVLNTYLRCESELFDKKEKEKVNTKDEWDMEL